MATQTNVDPEVEQDFREFWMPLVFKDGALDLEQVKRELFDYHAVIREVSRVYDHITNGRFSKPNTLAVYIISAAEQHYADLLGTETDSPMETSIASQIEGGGYERND